MNEKILIAIAPVEHHLEKRRVSLVSLRLHSAYNAVEGGRTMGIELKRRLLHSS